MYIVQYKHTLPFCCLGFLLNKVQTYLPICDFRKTKNCFGEVKYTRPLAFDVCGEVRPVTGNTMKRSAGTVQADQGGRGGQWGHCGQWVGRSRRTVRAERKGGKGRTESTRRQGWARILFKRTQNSCVLFRSFEKNATFFTFFSVLLKRTQHSLRSFPFFWKEHNVLYVLFRSFEKNATLFMFFSVLLKRTQQSLCSFPFFWKECNILYVLFHSFEKNVTFFTFFLGFISRQNIEKRT